MIMKEGYFRHRWLPSTIASTSRSVPNATIRPVYGQATWPSVWTGSGRILRSVRVHIEAGSAQSVRVRVELYVTDTDPEGIGHGVDARVWTDVNDRGALDERGIYQTGGGAHFPMHPATDSRGRMVLKGNNVLFVSDPIEVSKTGVFHATAQFSADGRPVADSGKRWVSINDIAHN